MKVLGFDISTVATGWAVVEDGKLTKKGVICPIDELKQVHGTKKAAKEAMRDEVARFAYIVKRASEVIDKTKPDVLVVEDSFMKLNASVLRLLARLSGGVLGHWIGHYTGPAYIVMASSARAKIGCRGNSKKFEVIEFLRREHGLIIEDDNEADAVVLALYGTKRQSGNAKPRRKTKRRWKR